MIDLTLCFALIMFSASLAMITFLQSHNYNLCRWLFHLSLFGYRLLHNLNLLFRQAVEFVDELVDLAVGGFDLALTTGPAQVKI